MHSLKLEKSPQVGEAEEGEEGRKEGDTIEYANIIIFTDHLHLIYSGIKTRGSILCTFQPYLPLLCYFKAEKVILVYSHKYWSIDMPFQSFCIVQTLTSQAHVHPSLSK